MGTAAQPTRENRTITVDFRSEAMYFESIEMLGIRPRQVSPRRPYQDTIQTASKHYLTQVATYKQLIL
jgi:hypothetical protein